MGHVIKEQTNLRKQTQRRQMAELLNKNFRVSITDTFLSFYEKMWMECTYIRTLMELSREK